MERKGHYQGAGGAEPSQSEAQPPSLSPHEMSLCTGVYEELFFFFSSAHSP